ncbi:MAG: uridine diphosphate-N-acetylglucosamine-binding protein YvcK [Allobranchiibius sp.]
MTARPAVAALGGGHGLAVSLQALQLVTDKITAIVTVADDGGSSGRLRDEFHILPPGDLRMALAALCDNSEWGLQWRDALQHRFACEGPLGGHALGNLIIASLWDLLGDPVAGLDLVGRLLGARGRVLPMAAEPLRIEASVLGADPAHPTDVTEVIGQVKVATTRGRVLSVRLHPDPPAACQPAVDAVREADWVILGPGSWFSSVMPHLLVPDLCDAIVQTKARKMLTLNMMRHDDETQGFSAADHLEVLASHAPDLHLDVVLADISLHRDEARVLEQVAQRLGARLMLAQVADVDTPGSHDPLRLAAAYRDVLD